jgi:hypothetical protein
MKGAEFRKWAERGCRIYGDDPWSFLRELAQNARDARARCILVDVDRNPKGLEVLSFLDDGTGMSFDHARKFLFRLYASSKEEDRSSAGRYGVGFWSVLRFEPDLIRIESVCKGQSWAVEANADLDFRHVPCALDRRGTRITLSRRATHAALAEFAAQAEAGLDRYCRHCRRNDRAFSPMEVRFRGRNLATDLTAPGPVSLRFRKGPTEGAVGLADEPSVRLLARGLPVWEGMLLDELSHAGTNLVWRAEIARGLAPAFVINGNNLDVVMSRNAVVDNAALASLRKEAARALDRLVTLHIRTTFPAAWLRRLWDAAADSLRKLAAPRRLLLAAALGTLAAGLWAVSAFVLTDAPPGEPPGGSAARLAQTEGGDSAGRDEASAGQAGPDTDLPPPESLSPSPRTPTVSPMARLPDSYAGSLVQPQSELPLINLVYAPPRPLYFRFLVADRFEPNDGFLTGPRSAPRPYHGAVCTDETACLRIAVSLAGPGWTVLPVPTGYAVVADSVLVAGRSDRVPAADSHGQASVRLDEGLHVVSYEAAPSHGERAEVVTPDIAEAVELPKMLRDRIQQPPGATAGQKVAAALALARETISYDGSPDVARRYAARPAGETWLELVLRLGKGDCDVINGLCVLLLRSMGVPARLAIGFPAADGVALPGLHAWTEYWDQGWSPADASTRTERPSRAVPLPAEGEGQAQGPAPTGGASPATSADPLRPAPLPAEGEGQAKGPAPTGGASLTTSADPLRPAPLPAEGEGQAQGPAPTGGASPATSADPLRPAPLSPGGGAGGEASLATSADPLRPAPLPAGGVAGGLPYEARRAMWGGASLVASALALLLLALRPRRKEELLGGGDRAANEALLAQMALSALSQPGAWTHGGSLWHSPLLPALGGSKRISISKAMRLAAKGRLFYSRSAGSTLTQAAVEAGTLVVLAGPSAFGPVVEQIPGGVDLQEIEGLEAIPEPDEAAPVGAAPDQRPPGGESILATVNRMLREAGVNDVSCLAAPGFKAGAIRDVDLRPLGLPGAFSLPPRFIAVNPKSGLVRNCLAVQRRNPSLAAFILLDHAARRSAFLSTRAARLRLAAARQVAREVS